MGIKIFEKPPFSIFMLEGGVAGFSKMLITVTGCLKIISFGSLGQQKYHRMALQGNGISHPYPDR
jgi:hypothetical protein